LKDFSEGSSRTNPSYAYAYAYAISFSERMSSEAGNEPVETKQLHFEDVQ
jgi:hypothetical protein